jgi:O-acetyl-ADP-ribose deacetylase (regulator of RNase III)
VYGYPLADAARVAVHAVRATLAAHPALEEARFWLFDQTAYDAFTRALSQA